MSKIKSTQSSSFGSTGRINHDSSKFYDSKLFSDISDDVVTDNMENAIPEKLLNTIVCGSAVKMDQIPDKSVHLMITSPPYNVSKEYDQDLNLKEYLQLLEHSFSEVFRVLVNGGRACINVANLGRKPYIPLSDNISRIMIELGYKMRGEIIWNKAGSASPSTAWGSWQSAANPVLRDVHEYILVFSKGNYRRIKNDKKNTIGKEEFLEWTKSIWTMNAESAKRIGHPAPFPLELPYRLIQLYSFTEDIVLDPFMGSGTTAIASIDSKRNYIGYEINEDYVRIANNRIESRKSQITIDF